MSLQYFKITSNGELIAANVKDIEDDLFINIKQYKSHVPVTSVNGKSFISCEIGQLFSTKQLSSEKLFLKGFPALKEKTEQKGSKRTKKVLTSSTSTKKIKLEEKN